MSKLARWLVTYTGIDIDRHNTYKYIAIDVTKRRLDNWGNDRVNQIVQFRTKQQFKSWLKSSIAKVDQEDWVLYEKVTQ